MRPSFRSFVFMFLLTSLLGACGQKGPLFLPGNPSEIRPVDPAAESAEAESGDEDDENPVTIQ